MASETSELTFVRCPSCRSLVPTSAVRCRICNNPLDGGGKAEASDSTRPPGRVRQKTITASAEELMQQGGFESEPAPQGFADSPVGDDNGHEVVDPLADFLQEFEPQDSQGASPAPHQEIPAVAAANDDEDDDLDAFLDEFDNYPVTSEPLKEPIAEPIVSPAVETPPVQATPRPAAAVTAVADPFDSEEDPLADFTTDATDDFDLDLEPAPVQQLAPQAPEPEPEYVPQPPPVTRPQQPRQSVEKRQSPPPPPQRPDAQQQNQKQVRPNSEHRDRPERSQQHRDERGRDRGDSHKHERRQQEQRKVHNQHGSQRPEKPQEREQHQATGPKTGKMRPGRLFGWLVSFESPDGRAIEIREGKFFVTGSSIRGFDLVIEDPSISTPHALMSISADHGLLIQDLMSERGIFVRSGDRGQYRREEGVVELKHGDWVRFGDVEFLLTVVPGGRSREH